MTECVHSAIVEVGQDFDGGTIYQCLNCGDVWNGGSE